VSHNAGTVWTWEGNNFVKNFKINLHPRLVNLPAIDCEKKCFHKTYRNNTATCVLHYIFANNEGGGVSEGGGWVRALLN
jgi:hypothetical protein